MRKIYPPLSLTLMLVTLGAAAALADDAKLGVDVAARCVICHGADGRGVSPEFPSLAGQHAEYLVKQIFDFKTGQRQSAVMHAVVNELKAADVRAVTAHFSRLPPGQAVLTDQRLREQGRDLYERGNPATSVTACKSCHGDGAAGSGQLPRLAGQNPLYLQNQLRNFRQKTRVSDRMMHIGLSAMSESEILAVAAYLASQN